MKHITIEAFDIPDAWYKAVYNIWHHGDEYGVVYGSEETLTKKLAVTINISNPWNRPLAHTKAPTDDKHIGAYALEYLFSGDPLDHPYTYGSRLHDPIDQLEEIVRKLAAHIYDRQCTAVLRIPQDIVSQPGVKMEPPCLSLMDFEILDNQLHTFSYFRSWDAYAGLPENIGGIQLIAESMVKDINEIIDGNLKPGRQVLFSKNCHLYLRQFEDVKHLFQTPPDSRRLSKKEEE